MKNNQVTLNLEEYNRLRDFETEIKKGFIAVIHTGSYSCTEYIDKDKAVQEIAEQNKKLHEKIDELDAELFDFKNGNIKEITITDVKEMSVRQFRKWKKQ